MQSTEPHFPVNPFQSARASLQSAREELFPPRQVSQPLKTPPLPGIEANMVPKVTLPRLPLPKSV